MMTTKATGHWTYTGISFINGLEPFSPHVSIKGNRREGQRVNIWDLSSNVRVCLNPRFARALFDKAGPDMHQLANKIGISYPFVAQLRRQLYSIPFPILSKLSVLSGISLEEIQDQVVSVRTRAGTSINMYFPIAGDERIASLVGHVFGDGYVGNPKKQFEYCNNNPQLLDEVKVSIKSLFGIDPMTQRWNRIGYPSIVGEILLAFGAPIAPKIRNKNLIPPWIKESRHNSVAFLKAFFDDDGSVLFSENYRAKSVNLYVIRHENEHDSLKALLEEIRALLKELGISSGAPLLSRKYLKKDGIRLVMYLNITDYQSIINFSVRVGLTEGDKQKRLERIIDRKLRSNKGLKYNFDEVPTKIQKPKKVLVLGSGSLKIGEAGEI